MAVDHKQTRRRHRPRPERGARPAAAPCCRRRRRAGWAPAMFLAPFGVLFALFFLLPIGYAVYESLLKVHVSGLGLGPNSTTTVFAGLSNYTQVFSDSSFLQGVGRVLLFGVVQIPVMLVFATVLALLLDSVTVRFRRFFRLAFFLPYGIPGVIAAILWSFLYLPGLSPIVAALQRHRLRHGELPRRQLDAVVHRQHRHLGVHGLQHADHLRGPAGHPGRPVRGRAPRRRLGVEDGRPGSSSPWWRRAGADGHLQHHRHPAAVQRAAGAARDHQQHQQFLHARTCSPTPRRSPPTTRTTRRRSPWCWRSAHSSCRSAS